MTSALKAVTFRAPIQTLVFQRVYHVFRTYPQFMQFRLGFPVISPILLPRWRTYANYLSDSTTITARAWLPTWAPSWLTLPTTQTPSGIGSGGRGVDEEPPARDPKRLTVQQLGDMLDNSSAYAVHRTSDFAAGTCKAPLLAEDDQHRKKNPTAPHGIYVTRGITGFADYGPYGVVFEMSAIPWIPHEGADYRFTGDELDPSRAVGYYHEDDLAKAKELRKS
jgi:hypothetical protein